MNELLEERKEIIASHNWAWGNLEKKTQIKSFSLRFFNWLSYVLFIGLLLLTNFLILNTLFDLIDGLKWEGASFLVALMIAYLINIHRYHLEHYLFFHYHQLESHASQINKEKNQALKRLLERSKKPRSIITFILGVLVLFSGIISYFGENETLWNYTLIPFVLFEIMFLRDLSQYFKDFKEAT